jgi:hypothetical protein
MADLHERAASELMAIVEQYSAGEAEVVRSYFEQSHTNEEHLDTLLRQMGREIQTSNWLHHGVTMLAELEKTVDRHDFASFLEHIAEETEHYVILADLAEWLAGRKLAHDEALRYVIYARWNPSAPPELLRHNLLPEATRMVEVNKALVDELGYDCGTPVMRLSEGGGGGAYVECMRLCGDPYRDRLGAAMRRILQDEIHHGPERIDGFARDWVQSDEDVETATSWLRRIMQQHLRVRNEIWCNPLSEERLAAIDRGDYQPMPPVSDRELQTSH